MRGKIKFKGIVAFFLIVLGIVGIGGIAAIAVWGSGVWGIAHSFPLPVVAPVFLASAIWLLRNGKPKING